jgi:hypothetical protein
MGSGQKETSTADVGGVVCQAMGPKCNGSLSHKGSERHNSGWHTAFSLPILQVVFGVNYQLKSHWG